MELNFFPIQPFLFTNLNNLQSELLSPSILDSRKLYIIKYESITNETIITNIIPSSFCLWVIGFNYNNSKSMFLRIYPLDDLAPVTIPHYDCYYTVTFEDSVFPICIHEDVAAPCSLTNLILNESYKSSWLISQLKMAATISDAAEVIIQYIEYYMFFVPVKDLACQIQSMIFDNHGFITIEEIAQTLSYSVRHISRVFKETFGYSPKGYCEYVRFQNVLKVMIDNPGNKNTIYLNNGFYCDQPHFQREFKKFTGITPRQFSKMLQKKI